MHTRTLTKKIMVPMKKDITAMTIGAVVSEVLKSTVALGGGSPEGSFAKLTGFDSVDIASWIV